MNETTTLERLISDVASEAAGPSRPVDVAAVTRGATEASSRWRLRPLASATRLVALGAIVAVFGGALLIVQPFAERGYGTPGSFSAAGSLLEPRFAHSATLLPDGRVLIVGGDAAGSAEIWDPVTGSSSYAGSLAQERDTHAAAVLRDGRVLIVGGAGPGDGGDTLSSAEVWDPATSTFSPAGTLQHERDGAVAAVLPDGRVLVMGGWAYPVGPVALAETWDPATSTFSPAGSALEPRTAQIPTTLRDGRVLIVDNGLAKIWDPATDTFVRAGSHDLGEPSFAALLPDGHVFVLGGEDPTSAATWDPATSTFSPAGTLAQGRKNYVTTVLPDGGVLILGGCFNPGDYCEGGDEVDLAEAWDPTTRSFSPAGVLPVTDAATATALPDGRVLIVGASDDTTAIIWEADEDSSAGEAAARDRRIEVTSVVEAAGS